MDNEMAATPLARGKKEKKGEKKVHHIEVHRNKGKGGGYIATHHHEDMQHESEQHHVPPGGMDEHLEQNMAPEGEAPAE